MKQYDTVFDATCGIIFCLGYVICIFVIVATIVYLVWCRVILPTSRLPNYLPVLIPFIAMVIATFRIRRQIFKRNVFNRSHIAFLLYTGLAMFAAFDWFQDPMHDIGLWFGSHGRWGCRAPGYILCDTTMPWILFIPVICAALCHWGVYRRRAARTRRGQTHHAGRISRVVTGVLAAATTCGGVAYVREALAGYNAGIATVLCSLVFASELAWLAIGGKGFLLFHETASVKEMKQRTNTE